jgi:hypothetical protein
MVAAGESDSDEHDGAEEEGDKIMVLLKMVDR